MDSGRKKRRKQSTNKFTRIVAMYMVHPGRPILLAVSTQKGTEAETAIIMLKELLAFFERERWKLKRIIILADGKYYTTIVSSYISSIAGT